MVALILALMPNDLISYHQVYCYWALSSGVTKSLDKKNRKSDDILLLPLYPGCRTLFS